MSHLTGTERSQYVQRMFGRIAGRYDLLNRLMTVGQDVRWRKDAIARLALGPRAAVADLGAGTGDIAFEIARHHPDAFVISSDFTPEMVQVGKARRLGHTVHWLIADAQNLPFKPEVFDATISGFLLRNVPDVDRALAEQRRALKPGGRIASLDTTPPRDNWYRPLLEFHLHRVIPILGRLVAGDAEAYTYLPSSTEKFLTAERLAERFTAAGFEGVGFVRRMFGTVGIHWGTKARN
ncbi:MAG: ubiquinone/menaquinone biosynthesis methyltransferase [Anaerolineae bacterium]|nr:MAG: ubiquinone/menaquinone biosynthesis methyltransferase [Anaerolineae bacterium]